MFAASMYTYETAIVFAHNILGLSNGESHVGAGCAHLLSVRLNFRDIYNRTLGLLPIGNDG